MAGEWKFLVDGKNPHAVAVIALFFEGTRDHERGLGEIHLTRNRLHLPCVEARSIHHNCELIAFKRVRGEYIYLNE